MARLAEKRKKGEETSGDERLPVPQRKTLRQSKSTVKFADTIQAVSFSKHQQPKSILKTSSTSFPTAPADPVREGAPSPEPLKQPEDEEFDTEEWNLVEKLAALQAVKRAEKEQLKQSLAAAQAELKEVLLANGRLETKLRIANEQVEKLERDLAICSASTSLENCR